MVLTANNLLGRDDKGNLLPVEVEIPELEGSVLVTPLSRGELLSVQANVKKGVIDAAEIDLHYVEQHLESPKLTREQVRALPLKTLAAVVKAILEASGIVVEDKKVVDAVKEAEEELRKKSVQAQ